VMNQKIKILINLIAVTVIVAFAFMAYGFVSEKAFWTEQKREAIKRFNDVRISSFSAEETQMLVDAITRERGWEITYFEDKVMETGYPDNPYTLVSTDLFRNKDSSKSILMDKLYLYDMDSLQWIPISEQRNSIISGKIIESKKTDIWSGENDWVKNYFKGDEKKDDPNWNKCAEMILSKDFDRETDLPEDHECYKVQQDFQKIFSL